MKGARAISRQEGFSLLELMIASAIFILLCGAAFGLLAVAQQRYQTESQVLSSFQEARFGIDQMVRDIDDSGYPSQSLFQTIPPPSQSQLYAVTPVAWTTNYPGTPCQFSVNCNPSPGDFDLIIETNVAPNAPGSVVSWVRYQLQNKTLFRAIVDKNGTDPNTATSGSFVPFVQNVMNNATPAQIAQIRAIYPTMFPGSLPVPIFSYICDTPTGPQNCSSPSAAPYNTPPNIQDVEITLIVQASVADAQTGAPRLVELHGRGHRLISTQ